MTGKRPHGSSGTASTAAAPPTVWLALPAYNEADNLPPLLSRVHAAWSGRFPFHVLVVDDGSRDGTAAVAEAAAQRLPVEVIRHERNRGLAAAIRTGIQEACRHAADGDVIVTMDADNSHPPELVPEMFTQLEAGYDLVIASRFVRGGKEEGVPWRRRLLSRAAGLVFKCVCPIPGVRDYTTGFRAYRAALLKELLSIYGDRLIEAQAFSVMTEILLKARTVRPRITEVPLVLRYDLKEGASKMRLGRTLRDYARLLGREVRLRKPARPLP
jgi:dolichol-phosphate mannosyltransferase